MKVTVESDSEEEEDEEEEEVVVEVEKRPSVRLQDRITERQFQRMQVRHAGHIMGSQSRTFNYLNFISLFSKQCYENVIAEHNTYSVIVCELCIVV